MRKKFYLICVLKISIKIFSVLKHTFKMNILLRFMLLLGMNTISIVLSQETSTSGKTGPGTSMCGYFGSTDEVCYVKSTAANQLPESCTSFLFEEFNVDLNYEIVLYDGGEVFLNDIIKSGKNVYVVYDTYSYDQWAIRLACITCDSAVAEYEAKRISDFVKDYPGITGLVLKRVEPRKNESREIVGFTENFKKYIEIVKQQTGLEILILFDTYQFIDYYDTLPFPWLDFPTLDSVVDFYLFSFRFFNLFDCTPKTRNIGLTPLNGSGIHTLENLGAVIQKAKIPKEKIFFMFELKPAGNPFDFDLASCAYNYQRMCQFPRKYGRLCSDTLQTFYEKGQWAQQNGFGFCGSYIDLDDPFDCCGCGPNPAFNAVLAGFKNCAAPPKCPPIDRN